MTATDTRKETMTAPDMKNENRRGRNSSGMMPESQSMKTVEVTIREIQMMTINTLSTTLGCQNLMTAEGTIRESRITIGMSLGRRSLRTDTGMMIGSRLGKSGPVTIQENPGLTIATGNKKKVTVRIRTLTGTTLEGLRLMSVQGTKKESLSQRAGMALGRLLLLKTTNGTNTRRIAATNRKRKIDAMNRKNKKIADTQKKRQNGTTSRMKTINIVMKVNLI